MAAKSLVHIQLPQVRLPSLGKKVSYGSSRNRHSCPLPHLLPPCPNLYLYPKLYSLFHSTGPICQPVEHLSVQVGTGLQLAVAGQHCSDCWCDTLLYCCNGPYGMLVCMQALVSPAVASSGLGCYFFKKRSLALESRIICNICSHSNNSPDEHCKNQWWNCLSLAEGWNLSWQIEFKLHRSSQDLPGTF